ncbi:MAG: hypothetical protein IIZ39_04475 [Blautia sp.]|nr:hypothetical protein [Blautia sp.]
MVATQESEKEVWKPCISLLSLLLSGGCTDLFLYDAIDELMIQSPKAGLLLVFFVGSAWAGLGNKRLFHHLLRRLAFNHTDHLRVNLDNISYYGCKDDYKALEGTPLEADMRLEVYNQERCPPPKPPSCDEPRNLLMNMERFKKLRINLAAGKHSTGCLLGWSSKGKYCASLKSNQPFELAKNALEDEDSCQRMTHAWDNLPTYGCKNANILVMPDLSCREKDTPWVYAATASVLFAQRNHGALKDLYLMPNGYQMCKISGDNLASRLELFHHDGQGFEFYMVRDVLEKVLDLAIEGRFPLEDRPDALLFVTHHKIDRKTLSLYKEELIRTVHCLEAYGLPLPNIIIWNPVSEEQIFLQDEDIPELFLISGEETFCKVLSAILSCNVDKEMDRLFGKDSAFNKIRTFHTEENLR